MVTRRHATGYLLALPTLLFDRRLARFEFSQPHMGTRFRLVVYAGARESAEKAASAAFERIAALDSALSDYRESSELMALCRKGGGPAVPVSDDLFRVLEQSQQIAARTGGAFDVTVGPLVRLWRRARRRGELPDPASLREARALVGCEKLSLDRKGRAARLAQRGMRLDLGGIAKGFAAAEALTTLGRCGIREALVAAGGDIAVSEPPPAEQRAWRIEIAPWGQASGLSGRPEAGRYLFLQNAAVSTSGDAEQYVEIGGVRYSHIVDPRTGLGVTGRSGATVVTPDAALSDALATAASVLGPKRGVAVVDSFAGAAALIIEDAGGVLRSFESSRWNKLSTG